MDRPGLRSLGHLTPDLVLRHDELRVFDAKYKAHFAELDETGWQGMAEDVRDSHRAPASPGAPRGRVTVVHGSSSRFACRG